MPRKGRKNEPRTDLPPERDPYYEGYFGTGEEEGIVRERDAEDADDVDRKPGAQDDQGGNRG